MSPTHANKGGARYRYYVSQAVLQNKPPPSGLVSRVPAAEIEALVVAALRSHLSANGAGEQLPDNDRDLLERYLERVTLTPNHLELRPRELVEPMHAHDPVNDGSSGPPIANVTTITVPWSSPVPAAVKGIIHVPAYNTPIKAGRREALLIAIAKARQWIDDLAHGRAASFAVIARRERPSGTSGCWHRSPSSHPKSCRHCSTAARRPISPSQSSPAHCPIAGLSRSGECIFRAFPARSIKFPVIPKKFPVMAAKIPCSVA